MARVAPQRFAALLYFPPIFPTAQRFKRPHHRLLGIIRSRLERRPFAQSLLGQYIFPASVTIIQPCWNFLQSVIPLPFIFETKLVFTSVPGARSYMGVTG
jgi:hypothetical protein